MTYIQRKSSILETVDEFTTRKEALAMLKECRLVDRSATYYLLPIDTPHAGLGALNEHLNHNHT